MTHNEDFERLTAPLRAEMVGYCYRMAGSADEAEDLTQESYLRAWRSVRSALPERGRPARDAGGIR